MAKKYIFDSYNEYWYYAKYLSEEQRKIIFKGLPSIQKEYLENSFTKEGWNDVFYRNEINEKIDEIKEAYNCDIIKIRIKVLKGKSVFIPYKIWKIIEETFNKYKTESVNFILGGIKSSRCKANDNVCLIFHEKFEKFVEK